MDKIEPFTSFDVDHKGHAVMKMAPYATWRLGASTDNPPGAWPESSGGGGTDYGPALGLDIKAHMSTRLLHVTGKPAALSTPSQ